RVRRGVVLLVDVRVGAGLSKVAREVAELARRLLLVLLAAIRAGPARRAEAKARALARRLVCLAAAGVARLNALLRRHPGGGAARGRRRLGRRRLPLEDVVDQVGAGLGIIVVAVLQERPDLLAETLATVAHDRLRRVHSERVALPWPVLDVRAGRLELTR